PLMWLCLPVWIAAREGPQIELQQNEFMKIAPSSAIRSRFGVGATSLSGPPYADMAFSAWSSEKMNTMFGRSAAIRAGASRLRMRGIRMAVLDTCAESPFYKRNRATRLWAGGRSTPQAEPRANPFP